MNALNIEPKGMTDLVTLVLAWPCPFCGTVGLCNCAENVTASTGELLAEIPVEAAEAESIGADHHETLYPEIPPQLNELLDPAERRAMGEASCGPEGSTDPGRDARPAGAGARPGTIGSMAHAG